MFTQPLPAVVALLISLNETLLLFRGTGLSQRQQYNLGMIITGIVANGTLNLTRISLACFGELSLAVISTVIHRSQIPWVKLQFAGFLHILKRFDIGKIHIQIDDTDLDRSKIVKALYGVFRTIHKPTNGYHNAQNIVWVTVCALGVTCPICFYFYRPDPALTSWHKKKKAAAKRKKKTGKNTKLPPKPIRSTEYPTRTEIAGRLLQKTKRWLSIAEKILGRKIRLISISADAAFLEPKLVKRVKKLFPGVQFISQLKSNQLVRKKSGKFISAESYFSRCGKPISGSAKLRTSDKKFEYHSARLFVKSHGVKLHIVALRYEGETEFRYLASTDLTWRTIDIIRAYSLRWLVEVVFQDCKGYCGFGRRACLQGAKGAYVSVFLNLLVDCLLLTHDVQLDLHHSGRQLYTAGSVIERLRCEIYLSTIKDIVDSPNPAERLKNVVKTLTDQVDERSRPSRKHIRDETIFDVGPSSQLQRRHGT